MKLLEVEGGGHVLKCLIASDATAVLSNVQQFVIKNNKLLKM